jgi:hypothetical protein
VFVDRQNANERVAELFRTALQHDGIVTREQIVEAVGRQLDPAKRVRRNGGARDILEPEGIDVTFLGSGRWRAQYRAEPVDEQGQ